MIQDTNALNVIESIQFETVLYNGQPDMKATSHFKVNGHIEKG